MKYMSIEEFRDLGFLQEINRLILHPASLALEVTVDLNEQNEFVMSLSGIQDYRHDPEGMNFIKTPSADKAIAVMNSVAPERYKSLGYIYQPLDRDIDEFPQASLDQIAKDGLEIIEESLDNLTAQLLEIAEEHDPLILKDAYSELIRNWYKNIPWNA